MRGIDNKNASDRDLPQLKKRIIEVKLLALVDFHVLADLLFVRACE